MAKIHVDDLARGIFMLPENNPYGAAAVNIGYGVDLTIKGLAYMIARHAGFEGKIIWDASKHRGR
jgi:GDP-L-fucose synthase